MLSDTEKMFLEDPGFFTGKHRRVIRSRINKKIKLMAYDIRSILKNHDVDKLIDISPLAELGLGVAQPEKKGVATEFRSGATEFRSGLQNSVALDQDHIKRLTNW